MSEEPNIFDMICWMVGCAVVITLLFNAIIN